MQDNELQAIVRAICSAIELQAVYLFGSHSRGNATADSDYDLCLISSHKGRRRLDISADAELALLSITEKPTDIVVFYADEFARRSHLPGTLEHTIFTQGALLHGA